MTENKRFYWLKLAADFYETDTMDWIQEQENGCSIIVLYQKLCLKSINSAGKLIRHLGNKTLAYSYNKLAELTKLPLHIVQQGMEMLKNLELIHILQDGTIFVPAVTALTGSETASTRRSQKCREIKKQKLLQELRELQSLEEQETLSASSVVLHCNNAATESKSRELEKDISTTDDTNINSKKLILQESSQNKEDTTVTSSSVDKTVNDLLLAGGIILGKKKEIIQEIAQEYGPIMDFELIRRAIQKAKKAPVPRWHYVKKLLGEWKMKNILTCKQQDEEQKEHDKQYQKRKTNAPEAFKAPISSNNQCMYQVHTGYSGKSDIYIPKDILEELKQKEKQVLQTA